MNLLEHYILKIHSEELVAVDWNDEGVMVKVDLSINCYGVIERQKMYFNQNEWEAVKEKGFYLA